MKLLKSTSGRGGEGDVHSEETSNMRTSPRSIKKQLKKLYIHMYGEKKVQSSQLTVVDAFQPSVNKL